MTQSQDCIESLKIELSDVQLDLITEFLGSITPIQMNRWTQYVAPNQIPILTEIMKALQERSSKR